MARFLLAATPLYGHVRPMAQIARALRGNGHDVTMLVGTSVAPWIEPARSRPGSGVNRADPAPRVLPEHRDRFRSRPNLRFGSRIRNLRPSWVRGRDEILQTFVTPLPAQVKALSALMQSAQPSRQFDAVVADVSFLGVQPLLLTTPRRSRPPVIGISATPIMLRSQDCAPFGAALLPRPDPVGRRRDRQTDWLLRNGPLRPVQRALDAIAAESGIGAGEITLFDAIARFDRVFQLGLPELEYPRRELPPYVEFVGPLPARCACGGQNHPVLDVGRPVVHVTQGTLDNVDLNRLLLPAIRALEGRDMTIIGCTGRRSAEGVGTPFRDDPRTRIVDFACYDWLLPRLDLMITNGGYGGVQLAARHGIPLIVAGDTQDKAEVAARVRWSGIGIDLRTGRPGHRQIAAAVEAIRADRRYAQRAAELAGSADRLGDPMDRIIGGICAQL